MASENQKMKDFEVLQVWIEVVRLRSLITLANAFHQMHKAKWGHTDQGQKIMFLNLERSDISMLWHSKFIDLISLIY